jgi:hypothetical protein
VALPRAFVGFSSTDIARYQMMCAWKANEHSDFNFTDFQLDEVINSKNENYVKQTCREKIQPAAASISPAVSASSRPQARVAVHASNADSAGSHLSL